MRVADGQLWLSPTDLGIHLECGHATTKAVDFAEGRGEGPHTGGEYRQLVAAKGEAHERAYLQSLTDSGRSVTEVELGGGGFSKAAADTRSAMERGDEVIYQATFASNGWRGRADFLERVETETTLGAWGYEPVDTKLARSEALPHHVLQLGVYAQMIEEIQGTPPRNLHLVLGSGRREAIRFDEVAAYVRMARALLERATREQPATEPYPCKHCAVCGFRAQCEGWWESVDHLSRVAEIRREQVALFREAGVETLTDLGALGDEVSVPGMRDETEANLSWQARLQLQATSDGEIPFELRPAETGRGFARLPEPSRGDVFFDIEGDPFWDPARELTFLFGVVLADGEDWRYVPFWSHDSEAEKSAFEGLMDLLLEQLGKDPGMHIYHYSPAEPSALKQLSATHGTREDAVDELLRREVFVDLYTVVKQALVVGAPSYGLKTVERLAGFTRSASPGSGADAVLGYERWRLSGDDSELAAIAEYNDEDCRATLVLRDWLLSIRGDDFVPVVGDEERPPEAAPSPEQEERDRLRAALTAYAPEESGTWLAGELLEYHRREARPAWWQWFARLEMDGEELLRDRESLAFLAPTGRPPEALQKSLEYELAFPEQEHKVAPGDGLADPKTGKGVNVSGLDERSNTLTMRRAKRRAEEALPIALVPRGPLDNRVQRDALTRVARSMLANDARYPALIDLLGRSAPRVRGRNDAEPLQTLDLDEQCSLARGLGGTYLPVQGPPGTGKTWLAGRVIVDLIASGSRVGVMALSHRAINNLLGEVEEAAGEAGLSFRGARKAGSHPDSHFDSDGRIENVTDNSACLDPDFDLVAGTSWMFAREDFDRTLDYLVVDEAGQIALADVVAAGTAALNLIVLGDPRQLPHVTQAIHPPGTGGSVLEHVLGDAETVAPEAGLFLPVTRRLHPDVCGFVSRSTYEGRLEPHEACAMQSTGAGTGIRYAPVEHDGRASRSPEEAARVGAEIQNLLGVEYCDRNGESRPLEAKDIVVVTPYNAQVRALRAEVPEGVRVGTVDRFQGQEAPVVFFSMATSSGDDLPRDVAFLFSRNRLNVAVSRAQCLFFLVCSPRLIEARAGSVDDMRLISGLCALVEEAGGQAGDRRVDAASPSSLG